MDEKFQLDPLKLINIRPINLVHLPKVGNKKKGALMHRRMQRS
jgi:hypothetical protein